MYKDNIDSSLPKREWNQKNEMAIKIDGKGKKMRDIVVVYLSYMDTGFNLSLEEAGAYLGCSYVYVLQELKPKVPHININSIIRKAIRESEEFADLSVDTISLLQKRILLHRSSFEEFLQVHVEREHRYDLLTYMAFQSHAMFESFAQLAGSQSKLALLVEASLSLFKKEFQENTILLSVNEIPDKLYSLQELKQQFMYKHNAQVYNLLHNQGVNKYRYEGMVRYDLKEIEENKDIIPIPRGYEVEACVESIIARACMTIEMREALKGSKNKF
ncbi:MULTISPECIES: hypothetical protein [unclassified Paenibacillus]|uniref:hypothetical protein n=1 Tax=unclassified Paenibacillus TaxID=185978 RepID=UPI002783E08C|nr:MULTISPECIES: hypothetical protein [unclassified Paenibacillus]MDQ0896326.1 hypothetical protein [Paenibacillus sp. V4I7]MDQ0913748.1 hypothetical protein [Paenibacillus sp. V4I5]